jgi:hypothetical protein
MTVYTEQDPTRPLEGRRGVILMLKRRTIISSVLVLAVLGLGVSEAEAQKVYWAQNNGIGPGAPRKIRRANLDGSDMETLITFGLDPNEGNKYLALDSGGGKMYFGTAFTDGPRRIERANLDGTGREPLVEDTGVLKGLALDLVNGKIYWPDSESQTIRRADLDGSNVETVPVATGGVPWAIAVDPLGGKIYWSTNAEGGGEPYHIHRANLDGTAPETIADGLIAFYMALDVENGWLYNSICYESGCSVYRVALDGSSWNYVIGPQPSDLGGIDLDVEAGKLYFVEESSLKRANLDGSGVENLFSAFAMNDIALSLLPTGACCECLESCSIVPAESCPAGRWAGPETTCLDCDTFPVYVDWQNNTGEEHGGPANPYNTVAEGLACAVPGGQVVISTGLYPENLTINQPVTLTATGGTVTIGQ